MKVKGGPVGEGRAATAPAEVAKKKEGRKWQVKVGKGRAATSPLRRPTKKKERRRRHSAAGQRRRRGGGRKWQVKVKMG